MSDEEPKSALELAMERLKKQDRDAGVEEKPLTAEQRATIAEAKNVAEAKMAEREILHHAAIRRAADADALAVLEEEFRRDRERIAYDRDKKIEEIRKKA
ncbi:MAG: hypothetical protein ACHQNV_03330 [Vicinamibacteria bacterium]